MTKLPKDIEKLKVRDGFFYVKSITGGEKFDTDVHIVALAEKINEIIDYLNETT